MQNRPYHSANSDESDHKYASHHHNQTSHTIFLPRSHFCKNQIADQADSLRRLLTLFFFLTDSSSQMLAFHGKLLVTPHRLAAYLRDSQMYLIHLSQLKMNKQKACTHLSRQFLLGLRQTKEILRMMSSGSFSYHNDENQSFWPLANKTMPCRMRCHQQDLSPQDQTDISARNHGYQEGCLHFHHIPPLLHAHVCLLRH